MNIIVKKASKLLKYEREELKEFIPGSDVMNAWMEHGNTVVCLAKDQGTIVGVSMLYLNYQENYIGSFIDSYYRRKGLLLLMLEKIFSSYPFNKKFKIQYASGASKYFKKFLDEKGMKNSETNIFGMVN